LIGDAEAVEGVEEGADGVVHAFDHGGVGWAALSVGGVGGGAVFFDEGGFGIEGCVDAEHPVVEEEGLVLVFFDEGGGFGGYAVFDVFVGGFGEEVVRVFPWGDEGSCGAGAGGVGEVDIEAVLEG
jgi:hypothetical protein